jgi:hypothetical protein
MHATGPADSPQVIQRGVWYRFEHELGLNSNYESSCNELAGA